jgi:hypothetical protein
MPLGADPMSSERMVADRLWCGNLMLAVPRGRRNGLRTGGKPVGEKRGAHALLQRHQPRLPAGGIGLSGQQRARSELEHNLPSSVLSIQSFHSSRRQTPPAMMIGTLPLMPPRIVSRKP